MLANLIPKTPLLAAAMAFALGHDVSLAASVNVYTERQPVFLEDIFEAFEQESGIEVNVLYLDKGAVERLRSEGSHSPADVVIVADVGRLSQLDKNGLVQPIRSAVVESVVPGSLRHPKGHWTALSKRLRVVYVPGDAASGPQSFNELGDADLGGKICIRSGAHPYNIALIAASINHHGEQETEKWLQGVKGNLARKPQGNDRAQIKGVASGACDMAVANLYYYFKMLAGSDADEREAAGKVRWLPVGFADRGAHVNVSGAAIAKHAANFEEAMALVEFMVGEKAQAMYANNNGELPVRGDIEMPGRLSAAHATKNDTLSLQAIAKKRELASRLVEKVAFDD